MSSGRREPLDGKSLGKQVRFLYADGEERAVGEMVGFSVVPQVAIKMDDGTIQWWRHDQAEVIGVIE